MKVQNNLVEACGSLDLRDDSLDVFGMLGLRLQFLKALSHGFDVHSGGAPQIRLRALSEGCAKIWSIAGREAFSLGESSLSLAQGNEKARKS